MGEARRFAMTSRDGVAVNERFHRASDLFVFDVSPGRVQFVARRNRPAGLRGATEVEALAQLLVDCDGVASLLFPGSLRRALTDRGFLLIQGRGPLDDLVRRATASEVSPGDAVQVFPPRTSLPEASS